LENPKQEKSQAVMNRKIHYGNGKVENWSQNDVL